MGPVATRNTARPADRPSFVIAFVFIWHKTEPRLQGNGRGVYVRSSQALQPPLGLARRCTTRSPSRGRLDDLRTRSRGLLPGRRRGGLCAASLRADVDASDAKALALCARGDVSRRNLALLQVVLQWQCRAARGESR